MRKTTFGQFGCQLVNARGVVIAGILEEPPVAGGWRRFLFQPAVEGPAQEFSVNQAGHWYAPSGLVSVLVRPEQVPEKIRRMAEMKVVQELMREQGDLTCDHKDRCVIAENRGTKCLTVGVHCRMCEAVQIVSVSHSNADGDEQIAEEVARAHAWTQR